jgi:IMP dehydrogenase
MKNMIELMRNKTKGPGKSIYIMAGNIGTQQAAFNLASWGADCLKVGLSNSKVCRTKHVTGVSTPMITAIEECASAHVLPIVGDSGIVSSAHAAKAIGAGASLVMCGSLFAGCEETPPVVEMTKNNFMEDVVPYRGNASRETMRLFRKPEETPTPEGIQMFVKRQGPAAEQLFYVRDGLKSAMSYSNATSIKEFHEKVQFQIIKGVSQ